MGIEALVGLAQSQSGSPGLNATITLLKDIYAKIENVKVYRQQCSDLSGRCVDLMLALWDNPSPLEEIKGIQLTGEMAAIVRRIDRKVNEWAALSRLNSFLRQSDIKDGIDRLHRDMDATAMKFNIAPQAVFKSNQKDRNANEERDKTEIRDVLEKIIGNNEDIKALLDSKSSRAVEDVMESLQVELHKSDLRSSQKQAFQQALWLLHERTSKLPPLIDLTGQVTLSRTYTSGKGTIHDVILGEWLGQKLVTLRSHRSLSDHLDAQKRFQREVGLWRSLNHPNVLSLYGIIHMDQNLYTIHPWMEHGNAIAYVQAHPAVDRLRILNDIAAGLEYLHMNDVVHGDIRGANILISSDGSAIVADFGLSKILEDCAHGVPSSLDLHPRWSAPELLRQTDNHSSPPSDVWSFAMVCLELMTGEQPFRRVSQDIAVLYELDKGKLPERPGRQATAHGLKDELWSLIQQCWHKKPELRPTMTVVNNALLEIRGLTRKVSSPSKRRSFFSFRSNPDPDASPSLSGSRPKPSSTIITPPEDHTPAKSERPDLADLNPGLLKQSSLSADLSEHDNSLLPSGEMPSSVRRFKSHPSLLITPSASSSLSSFSGSHFSSRALSSDNHSDTTMSLDVQDVTTDASSIAQVVDRSCSVSYGTLEGLVEKLVNVSEQENDLDYREAFFMGYSDFTTSEDLFRLLARRFHQAGSDPGRAEDRVAVQYNVLEVMHYWLTNPLLSVEPEILRYMRNFFVLAAQTTNSSATMVDKAVNLVNLVDSQTLIYPLSPLSPLSPGRKIPRTSDMTPNDLAIALSLLEGDKYSSILPADYITHLSRRTRSESIEAAYLTNNKIVLWVKQSVLHYDTIDSRAQVLKFFVNTAVACRNFRNFASVTAIANALHSAPIDRLRLTKRELPPHLRHTLDELDDLLDPSSNHKTYRAALRESSAEYSRERCIPWIAVHLRELYSTLQKYPSIIKVNDVPMINFERYIRFTDRVKEVLHYTTPDLERYRQQGQLAYLEHQLRKVYLTPDVDDALMERSRTLEAGETRDYRARKRELRRLGFRSP